MDTPPVGVVGDAPTEPVREAGGDPVAGAVADVLAAGPEAVVAGGESALLAVAAAAPDVPVLPVDAGPGVRSVARSDAPGAIAALVAGEYDTASLPLLVARSPLGETRALCDLMLVTGEPARISEYTVRSGTETVASFRADGVVVATPAGSHGYARRADGPVLAPELGAVVVVPVAPFATSEDSWVLPTEGLRLDVERDETPVELLADDRTAGSVVPGESVRVATEGSLDVAVVDGSGGRFA
ncbi:ATP-NAD kinase [Halosegnis marinus]|uniref:ATP-NAD kinase n=1 Tax=Halosegnis marinus TaxID=3034023 RepID=A0ABD5ZR41_9EURY|nr:ATP-NAD kinase [Halosegnis sp. DT85]